MKNLFIYYSLTGNGDIIANVYRNNGYDIKKLITKYKYPNTIT